VVSSLVLHRHRDQPDRFAALDLGNTPLFPAILASQLSLIVPARTGLGSPNAPVGAASR
jgi:hypothetical protein